MIILVISCCLLLHGACSELDYGLTINHDSHENNISMNLELGTRQMIKDSSYLLDRYPMKLSPTALTCRKTVKCVKMEKNICLGTKLPYTTTTLDLIPEQMTLEIIEVDKITVYIREYILYVNSFMYANKLFFQH